MISELLIGIFLHNSFAGNSAVNSKPQVLAEIRSAPSASVNIESRNLDKPSPLPSPSPRSKASVKPKSSQAVKSAQTAGFSSAQVLEALNNYRDKKGIAPLSTDPKLQSYAQDRANYLKSLGKLDKHAGHKSFMSDNGFQKLGFNAIAENQGYNFKGDAKGLIESFYAKSSGHNKNQLNAEYSHVGIGISGPFTNLVFGGKKR